MLKYCSLVASLLLSATWLPQANGQPLEVWEIETDRDLHSTCKKVADFKNPINIPDGLVVKFASDSPITVMYAITALESANGEITIAEFNERDTEKFSGRALYSATCKHDTASNSFEVATIVFKPNPGKWYTIYKIRPTSTTRGVLSQVHFAR